MRKLLRRMAKAEMARRGYSKVNQRMSYLYGGWRSVIGAYPTHVDTGRTMAKDYRGKKKYQKGPGSRGHLFVY